MRRGCGWCPELPVILALVNAPGELSTQSLHVAESESFPSNGNICLRPCAKTHSENGASHLEGVERRYPHQTHTMGKNARDEACSAAGLSLAFQSSAPEGVFHDHYAPRPGLHSSLLVPTPLSLVLPQTCPASTSMLVPFLQLGKAGLFP